MAKPGLDERMKALGTAIESARARLENRDDFENDDIGDLLETINDDFEEVTHDEPSRAHSSYDALEARLDAVRGRLDAGRKA
ncbi:MAG: hypothetical protein QM699_08860 [Amaricoccus sp.]|uniref:hypothetical protein n=1 Tax=Amaricoccus sp. TaxID=1872485 RepID=UPI0039E4D993